MRPRTLLVHLGGIGLVLMGIVDSSVIPTPGGQDLLVAALAASHGDWWPYYAAMGTLGGLAGGAVGYWLGRAGRSAVRHAVTAERRRRVERAFQRWGFAAVFVPALMPPPVPIGPFLLGAGAMRQPVGRFLFALGVARAIRYAAVAYVASRFGPHVYRVARAHLVAVAVGAGGLVVLAVVVTVVVHRTRRARR
jgi:membrane protein YqaA with SNARE-associated domain